jgi:2-amino-4-hydroxy-6-hydroxymethyldihydropteridine diphosphokinase
MTQTPHAGDWIRIERLTAFGIVGLHAWERERTQEIIIDASLRVDFARVAATDEVRHGVNYAEVSREMLHHAETIERHTVEALVLDLAGICLSYPGVEEVVVSVAKPRADPRARLIGVEARRLAGSMDRTALVSLGSNAGAEENLPRAAEAIAGIGRVSRVTRVYQTPPAGGRAGPDYLNAALALETPLPAGALVRRFKQIERELGRDDDAGASGQVPIDIDLCTRGDEIVRTGGVSIPRPEILEAGFLAPLLLELAPDLVHPEHGRPLASVASAQNPKAPGKLREDVDLRGAVGG